MPLYTQLYFPLVFDVGDPLDAITLLQVPLTYPAVHTMLPTTMSTAAPSKVIAELLSSYSVMAVTIRFSAICDPPSDVPIHMV